MYKKYISAFVLFQCILFVAYFNVFGIQLNQYMATEAFRLGMAESVVSGVKQMSVTASGQHIVDYLLVQKEEEALSQTEYDVSLLDSTIRFKEKGVYQFSPVANGRYYQVSVSQETIDAVDKVLAGEDVSEGALYFVARKYADPEKMKWFDDNLEFLFEHGGHEFFQ